ncbi:hypothetical protein FJT64_020583 [Amphibalanus amphitrite]|uniref:Uncharacterized protein n=1 Tax=Amphibalanus amphitrite TaxID=1232801 RepID=A0A6A4WL98_AMPAM|nr:hypothetical protein FJT64_020583 [Amphibalanus amphitrite]
MLTWRAELTCVFLLFQKSHSTISSASFNANLYRRHDDPYRRRSLSGGDAISDSNRMAILFRDSRGLPAVDPFMDTLHSTDLSWILAILPGSISSSSASTASDITASCDIIVT